MTAGRILVVEDDPSLTFLLVDSLQYDGFEVRHAGDGLTALEILSEWTPDAILLDLNVPKMDGWAFRKAQRELPEPLRSVPVIIVSGAHIPPDLRAPLEPAQFIQKPFDLDHLTEAVRAITR